jgi:branched-chain amino acid transport system substrate-binding protein
MTGFITSVEIKFGMLQGAQFYPALQFKGSILCQAHCGSTMSQGTVQIQKEPDNNSSQSNICHRIGVQLIYQVIFKSSACALMLCAALILRAETPAVTANAVRIHHIGPLTGPLAASNKEFITGAKLFLDKVNASGGVNARKIDLIEADDRQDAKVMEQLASELVARNEALAFFMPRTSPSVQALLKVAEPAGIPVIAPQVGPDFLYDPKQRVAFTVRASYSSEIVRALDLQLRLGRTSFAFLASDDAFGNPLVEVAAKKLAEAKLQLLVEKIDNRKVDVSVALDKFSKAKPDVVFLICNNVCAADFVNKYRQAGGLTQFIAISNNSTNAFIKALGNNAQGVIVMQVMPLPTSKTVRISKEYASVSEKAKIAPSHAGLQGYISARVLVEGLRKSGRKVTPASLISGLESLRNFDLGDLIISYGANDRSGSAYLEETIINRDGKFTR